MQSCLSFKGVLHHIRILDWKPLEDIRCKNKCFNLFKFICVFYMDIIWILCACFIEATYSKLCCIQLTSEVGAWNYFNLDLFESRRWLKKKIQELNVAFLVIINTLSLTFLLCPFFQMFGFHKPKMYRSLNGCCICRAKSSSSRFTDSKRYERDFQSCFG